MVSHVWSPFRIEVTLAEPVAHKTSGAPEFVSATQPFTHLHF